MTDIAMADEIRVGGIFAKSLGIFGRRFVPIILVSIVAQIPNYIAQFLTAGTDPAGDPATHTALTGLAALVNVVTGPLASGMVMYGVVQELRGRRFSAGESFGVVVRRLLPVIAVSLCMGLGIGLGAILLLVPGIMLACRWYVSVPACIAERTGVFESMGRSRDLTKGHRWQIFGVVALVWIAMAVVMGIVTAIAVALIGASSAPVVALVATLVLGTVVGALNGVITAVFYYEFRVAKEGVDIDKIASVFD